MFILLLLTFLLSFTPAVHTTEENKLIDPTENKSVLNKKDWTFIVYMAADNDLFYFSKYKLDDMASIGSTEKINIVVQLDKPGQKEKTNRLYIEQNKIIQVNKNDETSHQKLDSGNSKTLVDCCKWAINNYPANHYALILWNHGSGILDPFNSKAISSNELFILNPETGLLELNRSIEFLQFVEKKHNKLPRGICFSDTYQSNLTNQKLRNALATITTENLHGKKFDLIGFDACLMSMIEVAHLIEPFADIMVGSQEVELGTGWPYKKILQPFLEKTLSPESFGNHIVHAYQDHYQSITNDYTQSACKLSYIKDLNTQLNLLSILFISGLQQQEKQSFSRAIKASKSKRLCTYFSEPSYIDLHHFLSNILETIAFTSFKENDASFKIDLKNQIKKILNLISQTVYSNVTGKSLLGAKGLSIYFPIRYIETSYGYTTFAQENTWFQFILNFA